MITLAIIRRAMLRALQWRLLLLSPIALAVASLTTLFALSGFFGDLFDHSPRWRELTSLDSATFVQVAKALGAPAAEGVPTAIEASLVLALLFAPLLAGAALVVADAGERPRLRALLSGAGAYYPRLLRMQIAALLPLGVAGVLIKMVFGWAGRVSDVALTESAARTSGRLAWLVAAIAVFVAQLVVDAGRARLAAEPARRSAVVALGAGIKLIVSRPLRTLAISVSSTVAALFVAAVLLVIRQQLIQSSALALLLAFVLAQLAVAAVAWGHAARLCGLLEIARGLTAVPAARPRAAEDDPAEPAVTPPPDALAREATVAPQ